MSKMKEKVKHFKLMWNEINQRQEEEWMEIETKIKAHELELVYYRKKKADLWNAQIEEQGRFLMNLPPFEDCVRELNWVGYDDIVECLDKGIIHQSEAWTTFFNR